ncbi:MAG: HD domain-containing phosphohydrolase [Acholeplasmataceae bacterium]
MKKYARSQFYMAGIFLVVSIIMLFIIYIFAVQTIRERQIKLLELELETTELEVQLYFEEFEHAVDDIETYIEHNGTSELLEYITNKHKHHEKMASIYFGTVDNVMYNSTSFIPPPGFDLRTRIWYQMAVERNQMVVTPAFLNATQDLIISTISKPVYDGNTLLGVIGIDVEINSIDAYIESQVIGETGYSLLVDSNQHVITFPNHWNIAQNLIELSMINNHFDDYDENKVYKDVKLYHDKGAMMFTDIVLDEYTLIIFMPNNEFYQTERQFGNFFITVFVMINIIGIGFIIFNHTYIMQPLSQLDLDIGGIDIKHRIGYRLPIKDNDRFLDVKKSLNRILETSEEYYSERLSIENTLHYENQRFKLLIDSTQDFIIQIDKNHIIISAYGRGLTKLKIDESEFVGKTMDEVFSHDKIAHEEMVEFALKGEHKLYDWDVHRGALHLVYETSVSPIYDQNENIIGVVSISRDITEATKRQEEIRYINQHDYLTDLYNRRTFQEKFDELTEKKKYPLTMMMIDLNGLKLINDAFGHLSGDLALKLVAKELSKQLADHFVARIGGDEFAAIVTGIKGNRIEQLKDTIKSNVSMLSVENIKLSISIGSETIFNDETDFNDLIKKAENNMYRQKITESMSMRNNVIKAIHRTLTEKYREERIHSEKVSQLSYVIGLAIGLSEDSLKELKLAGMYHDIGKIAIPDAILDKPDALTNEEYEIMKTHTEVGYNILRAADEYSRLAEYALSHHERWDGKGYPRGLKGDEIPLFSRIINLADSFDAMTSNRSYRHKMTKDAAVEEIIRHAGKQFDPELARLFVTKVLKRSWYDLNKGE